MTHRVHRSAKRGTGGYLGRFAALAVATAVCLGGVVAVVALWTSPPKQPATSDAAPSGAVARTESAPASKTGSTRPPRPARPSTTRLTATAITAPSESAQSPSPAEATSTRRQPSDPTRTTTAACTPTQQWVFRPSSGSYQKIIVPCPNR